ncbi:unnamed protein product [Linum tenue]|uniref:Cytochrome P450 n=1 Tax=Linum tenue TaxID=586396 RepID=A0AAV0KF94_9ROSI|nr:unnamed protein product [Linum tenue]
MELLLLLLSCFLCLILTLTFLRLLTRNTPAAKLPPGPSRLPIIGNLHMLGDKPHQSLAQLAKIHGPLMSLQLGRVTTIVASSPDTAREILQKHDKVLSDRHVPAAAQVLDIHKFTIPALPVGSRWRNLRKVCNSYIFTTQRLDMNQDIRRVKVLGLLEGVRRHAAERPGEALDVGKAAFKASLNALSSTILSMDLAEEEEEEEKSSGTAREFKELIGKPNLGDYFPVVARLDLQGIQRRSEGHLRKILNWFGWVIDERRRDLKSESYVSTNDMLDTLLAMGDTDHDSKHEEAAATMDLFVAGTDTTTSTLEWAMTELLRNSSTLAKAKKELDQIIGKDIQLRESDIPRLPYLQAIVKETFRLHPTTPLLLPRKATADVEIHGFTIPKGAQILVNVWAIGRDSTTWDDPKSFVPERFLGSKVDVKGNNFELLPFGAGRRTCPGQSLALRMLHMMLGSLVHGFNWKLPDGLKLETLDMEEKFGLTLQKAKPLFAIPTCR